MVMGGNNKLLLLSPSTILSPCRDDDAPLWVHSSLADLIVFILLLMLTNKIDLFAVYSNGLASSVSLQF